MNVLRKNKNGLVSPCKCVQYAFYILKFYKETREPLIYIYMYGYFIYMMNWYVLQFIACCIFLQIRKRDLRIFSIYVQYKCTHIHILQQIYDVLNTCKYVNNKK